MVMQIELTRGLVAVIDDEDAELVLANPRSWAAVAGRRKHVPEVFYAIRSRDKAYKHLLMHRLILDAPDHLEVDHIDGDGLNNRRSNLRLATKSQNASNRRVIKPGKSSQYRGVCWNKKAGLWQASAHANRKGVYLGVFEREEDAAVAYDQFAADTFGEFAVLNFPEVS